MGSHVCDPPEVEDTIFPEVEEWTCPECSKAWELGWEESWGSVYRNWEPA